MQLHSLKKYLMIRYWGTKSVQDLPCESLLRDFLYNQHSILSKIEKPSKIEGYMKS